MSDQERRVKQITKLLSNAFLALYESDAKALPDIMDRLYKTTKDVEFDDFDFSGNVVDYTQNFWTEEEGGTITEEEAQEIITDIFIKLVETCAKSCISLITYAMQDLTESYALKRLGENENN